MWLKSGFSLSLIFVSFLSFSQTPDSRFVAGKIFVIGNQITDKWVIEREMIFNEGDTISDTRMKLSIGRVESTRLFNRVDYRLLDTDDPMRKNIEIEVSESIYHLPYIHFIPIPILNTDGGHVEKLSYGLGGLDRNFRGKGETVYIAAWIGYSPGFEVFYENPWIGPKDNRFYLSVSMMKNDFVNRSLAFDHFTEKRSSFGILVKKYTNPWLYAGIGIDGKQYILDYHDPLASGGTFEDTFFAPYLEISYDDRDVKLYSHRGFYAKYKFQKNGLHDDDVDNWYFELDNRYFINFGDRHALGFQSVHNITEGHQPIYQHMFIGYEKRVRSYFYSKKEGKNLMINSIEYRFPITDILYYSLNNPLLGDAGNNIKYGLSGTLFIDHGNFWERTADISAQNSMLGFGFGINLLVPYYEAIRFESSWNKDGEYEGILAVGISF